jgi:glucose/arabinose dehydrogenase
VLNLPPGFTARVFAVPGGSGRPRLMAFNADGVLHVAHISRVVALPDRDADGVADVAITAVAGLRETHSIAFYQGAMYVAETDKVIRYRDPDGDLIYEEEEILVDDIPSEGWHTSRTIAIDAANGKFYIAVGSPCDLCRLEQPVYGYGEDPISTSDEWDAILEFNLDGTGRRIFATGMRNAVGLDIHPATNELWATHNHFDLGGPHLPPEWVDIVRDGDFMGYPLAYGYQVWVDEQVENYQRVWPYSRADSLRVQRMKKPAALVEAHQAPLGMFFYDHPLFPDRFRHAAFVALHGGQVGGNLSAVSGFKVVAIFDGPSDGQAPMADFITGFGPPHTPEVWGKPVGITADPQGRLYVSSDFATQAIFRLEPTIIQGSWEHRLSPSVASGSSLEVAATIRIERFDPEGETPVVMADLSAFGGSATHPLEPVGDGEYRLRATLPVERPNGEVEVIVWIRQQNEAGLHSVKLIHTITVAPSSDALIYAAAPTPGWTLEHSNLVQPEMAIWDGAAAVALTAAPSRLAGWNVEFRVDRPFVKDGYKSLRFAFHPGDLGLVDGGLFQVRVNERSVGNRAPTGRYTLDREFGSWSTFWALASAGWRAMRWI